jgi:Uma2 family endonuclease
MAALPNAAYSPEEYLALDRAAEFKSEYHAGEILAMAGASENHDTIAVNVLTELRSRLKGGPCRPFSSDMRVHIPAADRYTYPDVTVVCGERQFADGRRDVLLNPTLVVEVLSRTTEAYNRGEKAAAYRRLPSLEEYLLIAQDRPHVEQYTRQPDGRWLLSEAEGLQAIVHLPSIGAGLALSEVYGVLRARMAERLLEVGHGGGVVREPEAGGGDGLRSGGARVRDFCGSPS